MCEKYAYLNGRTVVLTDNFEEFLRGTDGQSGIFVAHDAENGWSVKTEFNDYLYVYIMPPVVQDNRLVQERYFFETKLEGVQDVTPDIHHCTKTWEDAEQEHARMVAFARHQANGAKRILEQKNYAEPPKPAWNGDLSEVVHRNRNRG